MTKTAEKDVRRRLVLWRVKNEHTQEMVAAACGISKQSVSLIESGGRPSVDTAVRIEHLTNGEIRCQDWVSAFKKESP